MKVVMLTWGVVLVLCIPVLAEKVRIVYRADGGVSVIHPAPKSKRENETKEQWLNRVFTKAMRGDLKDRPYDDVDKSEIPTNRKYRSAWKGSKGDGISIDVAKKAIIDAKTVYTEDQEAEIRAEVRKMAIKNLKAKGEL